MLSFYEGITVSNCGDFKFFIEFLKNKLFEKTNTSSPILFDVVCTLVFSGRLTTWL